MENLMANRIVPLFVAVFFLISGYQVTYAQERPVKFGVRGGFNFANTSDVFSHSPYENEAGINVSTDKRYHGAANIGAFVEYWFGSNLALQLNASYMEKGVKYASEIKGSTFVPDIGQRVELFMDANQTLRLTYLSVPLMAKFAFREYNSRSTTPFICAGPEFGFLLKADASDVIGETIAYLPGLGGGATSLDVPGADIKDDLESLEYGLNFGGGLMFPLGDSKLFLDGWYFLGLSKINKEGSDNIRNTSVNVNLGLIF
jgi:hypothetical protein